MRYQNDIEMDAEEVRDILSMLLMSHLYDYYYYHALIFQPLASQQKMARNIREKSKEGVGSIPEAIKEICFTWGREKTDFFQQQNDHLKSKGM